MSRPRLLDLMCGAGGAAVGYHRAGFDVVGVDIADQPRFPFPFKRWDALTLLAMLLNGHRFSIHADGPGWTLEDFAAIHASPPCQKFTDLKSMSNAREHPDLIGPTRELLEATGLPYVIENVPGAPLREPFQLCGTSFALRVPSLQRELRRHRLFETNWHVGLIPRCSHVWPACGVYGDHFRMGRRSHLGEYSGKRALEHGSEALGIDWMTWQELTQAIPPAYCEFVGAQLLAHIQVAAGASR